MNDRPFELSANILVYMHECMCSREYDVLSIFQQWHITYFTHITYPFASDTMQFMYFAHEYLMQPITKFII